MAYPLLDLTLIPPWVCPECLYKNKDYQRCMGPDCNSVMPGRMFDTSQFAGVAMNQPAAATARGCGKGTASKMPPPPQRESPQRAAKTNAAASIMILSHQHHYTGCLPYGLPSLLAVRTGGRAPVPCSLFLDDSSTMILCVQASPLYCWVMRVW
jgi:hypothetical protein